VRDVVSGGLDEGQVGNAIAKWGRHCDHGDIEGPHIERISGRPVLGFERRSHLIARYVVDERSTVPQAVYAFGIRVVPDDSEPELRRSDRDRQADVALPYDDDLRRAVVETVEQATQQLITH
jgi:hypothetical protein